GPVGRLGRLGRLAGWPVGPVGRLAGWAGWPVGRLGRLAGFKKGLIRIQFLEPAEPAQLANRLNPVEY
ncbi:MAG: hypothetical protein PVG41_17905, partial [Desulfobacteraceae bacterium]